MSKTMKMIILLDFCVTLGSVVPITSGVRSLSYLTGYIIRSIYQKTKNSPRCNSSRNKEIQALMYSMRVETEGNDYISSLSRGGLWSPHTWMVSIAKVSEIAFRRHTNQDKVTRLPVDTIVNEVISSPLVKNLWCNIIQNCDVESSRVSMFMLRKCCEIICYC